LSDMLTIDGSFGEGGGQILRTTLSLSAITGQDVAIENIRAGRDKPGLRPQHLTAVLALAEICGAEVRGADVGSSTLVFRPRAVKPGRYDFDVSRIRASAGSVNLVLQTVLWPLVVADKPSCVTIRGGTHVPKAPTSDFIECVFLPTVARMGCFVNYQMNRAGYYPTGRGEISAEIIPAETIAPVSFTSRPEAVRIELTSAVSNLPMSIAERQMGTGAKRLRAMGLESKGRNVEYPSLGKGTLFFISCASAEIRAGFQSLGEIKKRAEAVADEACDEFESYHRSGMALDPRLADQIIIPMALARGRPAFTTSRITQHLLTNVAVVERSLPVHFHVSAPLGEPGKVERVE